MSERRSKRLRSSPARLEDEQATIHFHQQDERELQRTLQASLDYDIDDSSDEDTSIIEHDTDTEEEEKQASTAAAEPQWREEAAPIVPSQFTSRSDPQTTLTSPLDLLQLFLPIRLLRTIAGNTTAYALSKGADSTWYTTAEELYRFIAIHIGMGINQLPSVHMYWDSRWRCEAVSSIFTRDRYMELLRYFHISSPTSTSSSPQPLSKLQPLLDELSSSFPAFYRPSCVL